jgi:hypothetical protein
MWKQNILCTHILEGSKKMIIRYLVLTFLFMGFSISSAHAIFAQSAEKALSYNNVFAPTAGQEYEKQPVAATDEVIEVDLRSAISKSATVKLNDVLKIKIKDNYSWAVTLSPSDSWRMSGNTLDSDVRTFTFAPLKVSSGTIYIDGKDSAGTTQVNKSVTFTIRSAQ